jgi:hypothetical protein
MLTITSHFLLKGHKLFNYIGYERSSVVEYIKQAMNNVQSIRQTGKQFDVRNKFNSNIFCQSEDSTQLTFGFCISDKFDEHEANIHIQRQQSSSIIGTSNGYFVRQLLDRKFNNNTNWLMIFIASKARLYCQRLKVLNLNQYPSIEHLIIVINCLCSNLIDFYFDQTQTNQLICDYLDTLSFKGMLIIKITIIIYYIYIFKAVSLEDSHPWMASRYLSAREHVLRVSASLHIIEMAIEILIVYRQTFLTFGQADKIFFDNCIRIIEKTNGTTIAKRFYINSTIVQSAIYFVNISIKQFEIMFEPTLSTETSHHEYVILVLDTYIEKNSKALAEGQRFRRPDSVIVFLLLCSDHFQVEYKYYFVYSHSVIFNQPSASDYPNSVQTFSHQSTRSSSPPPSSKRLKTMFDPSYVKSLELAREILLLPFIAFTRTSVYANSKIKRYAGYLDFVIEELKRSQLIILVRQGVQMIDGTRRRVDLLVKCPPVLNEDEIYDKNLMERLKRFGVDYDCYIQTLGTLDISEKHRLSDQCFDLLNSSDYKRYLTIDLERLAPLN